MHIYAPLGEGRHFKMFLNYDISDTSHLANVYDVDEVTIPLTLGRRRSEQWRFHAELPGRRLVNGLYRFA